MHKMVKVQLGQLQLDPENPRFDPVQDELQALSELCEKEQMVAIAEDVVERVMSESW